MPGLLERLLTRSRPIWPAPGPITEWPVGDFNAQISIVLFDADKPHAIDVVGESAYQGTLERIGGGRTVDGCRERDHTAVLLPEPSNRYDRNAVRVVAIPWGSSQASGLVGYLSREDAVAYRPVIDRLAEVGRLAASAISLTGGWDRGGGDRGHIGVRLHIDTPTGLMKELESDPACLWPAWETPR
jgi:hypothetical protein